MSRIKNLVDQAISETGSKIEPAALQAFISVESGGRGFCPTTGKIMIQFEPHWFMRKSPYSPSGKWSINKIERQSKEWEAFNSAFSHNPDAAMQSTSIGLPQIMGFHYARLGHQTVGDMWDDFKVGELNQVKALIKFIETDRRLLRALLEKDWHLVAYIYNGAGYAAQAHRLGIEPYNVQMSKAYFLIKGDE
jgi:hypothetical protein